MFVPMYQEDFHLSHYRKFPPPPQKKIAAVTHGKRTKTTISSNPQSYFNVEPTSDFDVFNIETA